MKNFVLKLGGHLLFRSPNSFLEYAEILKEVIHEIGNIYIVVGGGQKAREYIDIGRKLSLTEAHLDQIGIMLSRVNAYILYSYLSKYCKIKFISNWEDFINNINSGISLISGGLLPSISTTTVACIMAEASGATLLYATDVEGVYDKDPKVSSDAKLFHEIEINELINVLSKSQDIKAGQYKLFDRHSLEIMKRSKIPVRVFNGLDPRNIIRAIKNENIGTLIYYK